MTITKQRIEIGAADRPTLISGGIGALVAAAAFIVGIALFVTSLSDYTEGDLSRAESISFLIDNEMTFYFWYLLIFLIFGIAIIPLARTLHLRLRDTSPLLADIGAVFAYIWAGLMFATGMTHNIGMAAVIDLKDTDPAAAESLLSSIETVADGLGGGNELVGGMWILLVSIAAWARRSLPISLNVVGIASGAAGLVTLIPGLSDVGMIFGLGSILWFAWVGIVLLRTTTKTTANAVSTNTVSTNTGRTGEVAR